MLVCQGNEFKRLCYQLISLSVWSILQTPVLKCPNWLKKIYYYCLRKCRNFLTQWNNRTKSYSLLWTGIHHSFLFIHLSQFRIFCDDKLEFPFNLCVTGSFSFSLQIEAQPVLQIAVELSSSDRVKAFRSTGRVFAPVSNGSAAVLYDW